MLVDPDKFPGPAMWQGVMLIAVAFWLLYIIGVFSRKTPSSKSVMVATIILFVFGIVLMVAIVKATN